MIYKTFLKNSSLKEIQASKKHKMIGCCRIPSHVGYNKNCGWNL